MTLTESKIINAEKQLRSLLRSWLSADEKTVAHIINMFHVQRFKCEEYFLKKNEQIRKLGFVVEGVLRIFTTSSKGDESNIILMAEGSLTCGSFLPIDSSDVNIQCLTDVIVLTADYRAMLAFLEKEKLLLQYLSAVLARSHNDIQTKLTEYIKLNAAERYRIFIMEHPDLINRIPHYHVANYLGISSTQLSRIRNRLARKTHN